jgi:hypothetical protein
MKRRDFLLLALSLSAGERLRRRRSPSVAPWHIEDAARAIVGSLGSPASAGVIGAAYLAQNPLEWDRARLLEELDLRAAGTDRERIRSLVGERQRDDFASGRVVEVNGWILSQTEVRLYALAAL